jgi:peptide-methionine (S)-S-oxide reductase
MAQATFGAGRFWGVEVAFLQVPGVIDATVGYAGGTIANPLYEQVCTGRTGHAEVVQVEYDPAQMRYEQLLDVFFANHDPTQPNRQGPDVGTQYRSVIFYHDEAQAQAGRARRRKLYRLPGAIVGRW